MGRKFRVRLMQLRSKKGISQQILGELCGISPNTISAYECGERLPSFRALMELADYFEVSLDWLCGREN